jgi:MFS family permease
MLVSFSETSINIGILLGFVSVFVFNAVFEPATAWRVMLFCGVPTPLLMTYLSLCVMPETPRWLYTQGRMDECREVTAGAL